MCIDTKDKRDTGQLRLSNRQGASCELEQGLLGLLGAQVRAFVGQQSWLPVEKWILLLKTRNSAQQRKQVQRIVAVKPSTEHSGLWAVPRFCYSKNSMCPSLSQDLWGKKFPDRKQNRENQKTCVSSLWCFLQRDCLSMRIKYKSFAWQMYPSYSLGSGKLLSESPDIWQCRRQCHLCHPSRLRSHNTGVQSTLCVKKGLRSAILKHLVSLLV